MTKWKLTRQKFGSEEYALTEGQKVTVGRGTNNIITLSSAVISRNHCVISVQKNKAIITDLQSSNGVYVGTTKIPPNTPYVIEDCDVIGLGWTIGAPLVNINDSEKYVFKLSKEKSLSIIDKIRYQSENEIDDIEAEIARLDCAAENKSLDKSPVLNTKKTCKRKLDTDTANPIVKIKKEDEKCKVKAENVDVVIQLSDSDIESNVNTINTANKNPRIDPTCEEPQKTMFKDNEIKNENELLEAFNVKQEYLGYDEPIQIDSDSDSESEQWLLRLSQSSPGKPFMKISKSPKPDIMHEDSSYSQLDDLVCVNNYDEEEEDFYEDIISIPLPTIAEDNQKVPEQSPSEPPPPPPPPQNKSQPHVEDSSDSEFYEDIISINIPPTKEGDNIDVVDGFGPHHNIPKQTDSTTISTSKSIKKTQMIEPIIQSRKEKSQRAVVDSKSKRSSKHKKSEKSSSKRHISHSQKEERKKKLKEIACKDKESDLQQSKELGNNKPVINVKMTTSNRGAFLSDTAQAVVKPVSRTELVRKSKNKSNDGSPKEKEVRNKLHTEDVENQSKHSEKSNKDTKKSRHKDHSRTENKSDISSHKSEKETRHPLKSLKPLSGSDETYSGKPISKVGPVQTEKIKKTVRFSELAPQVLEFEIEPGNKMKKTSLVKAMFDVRQAPIFSLEKITLMKILRWNPQWFEEQLKNNDPPPILGHNKTPMSIFHSFVNHNQYVHLVGDLLLMEIWECLTIGYMNSRNEKHGLQMRIENLPPCPSQERYFELFTLSVNISVPSNGAKNIPRVGELLIVTFGPENAYNQRFFFVHNVRCLPAPASNRNLFYSISLQCIYTEKMMLLRPGELVIGKTLAYINKELMLFEAMEYLAGSPLSEAILRPEPQHFKNIHDTQPLNLKSQWTATLNPSQLTAVNLSVSAALSDKPSIQMVQGPPGTGKSSVICAIVMTYFYNEHNKKQQNRSKILICATSNTAVDGIVVRLLNMRQSLPKPERFRMVRVGRAEAMHPVAANVSSQQLAQRDLAARAHTDQPTAPAGLNEEILYVEGKINMWKTASQDAKDPVRVAYCQGKVAEYVKRMTLLRSGSSDRGDQDIRPEQIAKVERRIIEGADIIVTTLASAQNHKMRGLKSRIALCIIDEAGQVIEPETLIPLTLDVTRLTLIGDPQQLPGFICSQRAKKHGLNESLFSRLTSCAEQWSSGSPVVLLNQQYRMHPDIADYPSRAFYDGMIQTIAPSRPKLNIPPYNIVCISSGDKGQGVSGANEMEAWGVSRLVIALSSVLRPFNLKLAVITPYNSHKDLIKRNLRSLTNGECTVEVNTVDSFQGQERDVVVVSLARSQGVGFLTDAGRMNVMLTRARHALLICLNPHALMKNHQWRTLVEDAQKRHVYKVLPNKMCQPITSTDVSSDEILKYIMNKPSSRHR